MIKYVRSSIVLGIILFLSSCANVNVVSKRYSNGLNISLNKNTAPPEAYEAMGKREVARLEKRLEETGSLPLSVSELSHNIDTKDILINELPEVNRVQGVSKSISTPVLDGRPSATEPNKTLVYKRDNVKKISPLKMFKAARKIKKASKVDDTTFLVTVLLVILAFFIPWLAVLIAEGLSSNFWLSVLLSVGAYVLLGLGMYTLAYVVGIVAIIHAVLVVLGRS